jgi:exonuclease SbcC
VRINSDGSTTSLANKSDEVSKLSETLIGLNSEQFQKVLLLPQGDFHKFLLDDSKKREEILSKLFDGAIYEQIVEHLDSESKSLQRQLGDADRTHNTKVGQAVSDLEDLYEKLELEWEAEFLESDRDHIEVLLLNAQEKANELRLRATKADEDFQIANNLAVSAQSLAGVFDRAGVLKNRIRELESSKAHVKENFDRATNSRKARPLLAAWNAREEAQTAHTNAENALHSRVDSIVEEAKCFGTQLDVSSAQSIVETIGKFRDTTKEQQGRIDAVVGAKRNLEILDGEILGLKTDLSSQDSSMEEASKRLEEIGSKPSAEALEAELSAVEAAISGIPDLTVLDREVAAKKLELLEKGQIFDDVLEQFLQTEAPRLAQRLREGDPCPVCGSASHPMPAKHQFGEVVDYQMVGLAKKEVEEVDSLLKALSGDRQKIADRLGDYQNFSLQDLEERKKELIKDSGFVEEITRLKEAISTAATEFSRLKGQLEALNRGRREALENLEIARSNALEVDENVLFEYSNALSTITPLLEGLTKLFVDVTNTENTLNQQQQIVNQAESESGFTDITVARQALVTPTEEEEWVKAEETHRNDLRDSKRDLEELENDGLPEFRPDVEKAQKDSKEKKSTADELNQTQVLVGDLHERVSKAISDLDGAMLTTEGLRHRAELARRAQIVCSGQGHEKVSLPRWVLGRELDRIVEAATIRLQKMTNGRYSLRRKKSIADRRVLTGLDIEVFDSHTGRTRGPNSLSGGEQFQASLALALGLADVVSRGGSGSGKRPQALFIDEGFGSLDPKALDDVIETLQQLQATGRLVGAITHVPEMKERLHQGIVVSKRPDGRGSTLQVHS